MDCVSDHNALVAEVCLKLKKSKKLIPRTKLNTEALDQYKLEFNKAIEDMRLEDNETDNVEKLWRKFKSALSLSLKKTHRIDRPKKPWISHHTWKLIKKREQIKIRGIREGRQLTEYNELYRMINQSLRKEKDQFINSLCKEIEQHKTNQEPRFLFKKVAALSRSFKSRYLPIKDENGVTLSTKSEVIKRWPQYCEKLMASDIDNTNAINQRKLWDESEPPLIRSEIEMAIKRLRNHKVAGSDDIVAEMIKATTEKGVDIIHKICSKIWTTGEWPK